tara:strand:+ start:77907 stop:78140 length:234 start_codon:yes stop_codon:yes gene_type:complete
MSNINFEEGNKVTWTHSTSRGNKFSFTTRNGRVLSVNGDIVTVVYRGKSLRIHSQNLRLEGEKSPLTEMVEKMARQE